MSAEYRAIIKALGLKFAAKAIHTFDRATIIVVGVCWGAAILMIAFSIYAVILSTSTKRAAEEAAASEPILPKIVRKPIDLHDARPLVDRLQHRYPGINITLNIDQSVTISSMDGPRFREWLTAVSYTDIISPRYRWTIKEFCVGKCIGGALMRALLIGESIAFEAPKPEDENSKH